MMRMLRPITVNDANLVSSTAPETDYAAWSGATTYAAGDRRILASTHRIYESAQAGNLNHNPATDDGTWWLDIGPTNRWAMFDAAVGTLTGLASPLTVVLDPGLIDGLALLDITGNQVDVAMTVGAETVYARTVDIADATELVDWWMYFFAEIDPQTRVILDDLPSYADGRLTVSITSSTTVACGTFAAGRLVEVGTVRPGAKIGIIDYSRKETDAFGVTAVVKRAYAKRVEVDVAMASNRVDYLAQQLAAIRATPVVWIGAYSYDALVVYGFLRDWGVTIGGPFISDASLTIEGLT